VGVDARSPVNFVEWDGLIRLCFNRKNKTLNSSLRDKKVLKMIEENYKTFRSLNAATAGVSTASFLTCLPSRLPARPQGHALQAARVGSFVRPVVNARASRRVRSALLGVLQSAEPMPDVKMLVEEALAECDLAGQRPLKMSQDDFIQLLSAMNQRGIHFS
jgi:18S rRNA (adenine1779-N6/adenine1780-N6)-dimethyltransferase